MDDDGNVIDATRKINIRKLIERPAPPEVKAAAPAGDARRLESDGVDLNAPPSAGDDESFDAESTDYKACGWVGNKTLPALRVILKNGSECYLPYGDLDAAYPGGCEYVPGAPGRTGSIIILRMAGRATPFLVIIEGLRLRRVWELICGHRTPWIHELPTEAGFYSDTEPVIRSITFKPVPAEAAAGGR